MDGGECVKKTEPPEVLTLAQACELLGLSSPTVVKYFTSGELPGRRIGSQYRFRRSDLLQWITDGNRRQKTA